VTGQVVYGGFTALVGARVRGLLVRPAVRLRSLCPAFGWVADGSPAFALFAYGSGR
jgi:hypothetical protein